MEINFQIFISRKDAKERVKPSVRARKLFVCYLLYYLKNLWVIQGFC